MFDKLWKRQSTRGNRKLTTVSTSDPVDPLLPATACVRDSVPQLRLCRQRSAPAVPQNKYLRGVLLRCLGPHADVLATTNTHLWVQTSKPMPHFAKNGSRRAGETHVAMRTGCLPVCVFKNVRKHVFVSAFLVISICFGFPFLLTTFQHHNATRDRGQPHHVQASRLHVTRAFTKPWPSSRPLSSLRRNLSCSRDSVRPTLSGQSCGKMCSMALWMRCKSKIFQYRHSDKVGA